MATEEKANTKDLWNTILKNAQEASQARNYPDRNLIVLGDVGSGKSTLLARLRGEKVTAETLGFGTGLEFTYLDVREEDSEEVVSRLGVSILDGNTAHCEQLSTIVTKETVSSSLFIVVVDMAHPWGLAESLNKWTSIIAEHVTRAADPNDLIDMKKRLSRHTQGLSLKGEGNDDNDGYDASIPNVNLGVPLIIVATKCDRSLHLEKQFDFKSEHFDFIQYYLRKFSLLHGAAVIYTGKDGKTTDLLYRYILHRAFEKEFNGEAIVSDHEHLFVPAGWDNEIKLNLVSEGMQFNSSTAFDEFIHAPSRHNNGSLLEIVVEDEQEFLKKQLSLLGKAVKTPSMTESSSSTTSTAPHTPTPARELPQPPQQQQQQQQQQRDSNDETKPVVRSTSPKNSRPTESKRLPSTSSPAAKLGPDGKPIVGAQNAEVLANFFSSLLKKPAPGVKSDAAPEKK